MENESTSGKATYCVKIVPSGGHPYFTYCDATSEKAALTQAREAEPLGNNPDTFAQVGVFFTNHILHELAKGMYLSLEPSKAK